MTTDREGTGNPLYDLIETIQFTEAVSTKIHGLRDKDIIFKTIAEQFSSLQDYIATALLLSRDNSYLKIIFTSLPPVILEQMENAAGIRLSEYKIQLDDNNIFTPVVLNNQTVIAEGNDILSALLPEAMTRLLTGILEDISRMYSIITPVFQHGEPIGLFILTSHKIIEQFIPSVRNLALHISTALDLSDEHNEARLANEALQKREGELRFMLESIKEGIIVTDINGIAVDINDAALKMGGFKNKQEAIGRNGLDFIAPEDRERAAYEMARVIDEGFDISSELKFQNLHGDTMPVEATSTLYRNNKGEPIGYITILRDITKRKQSEEAILRDLDQFQSLFDSIDDGVIVVDLEGMAIQVNEATLRMGGFDSKDEVIGKLGFDFIRESDRPRLFEALSTVIETGRAGPVEFMVENEKGGDFPGEAVATLMRDQSGNPSGIVAVFRDITERKLAEEVIQRSERYFRLLIENSPDTIVVLNTDATIRYISPSVEKLYGYQPEDLIGQLAFEFVHPDEVERVSEIFFRGIEEPGFTISFETRLQPADGSWRYVELTGKNLLQDSAIEGIVLNFHDIDKRKKSELMIYESEQRYRTLVDGAGIPITYLDSDGQIVMINRLGATNLGGVPEDFIGKSVYDVMPQMKEKNKIRIRRIISSGKAKEYEDSIDLPGGTYWFSSSMQPVRNAGGDVLGVQIISHDITEIRQTETRIRHLNAVLRAMRYINELIIKEDDPEQMMQSTCDALIETRGYGSTWIALTDRNGEMKSICEAGVKSGMSALKIQIKAGNWPCCAAKAFRQMAPIVIESKPDECADCVLASTCGAGSSLSVRLEYSGTVYGVLCVGRTEYQTISEEERALFEEVAGDIGFAIQGIEVETERAWAEELLRESEDRFKEIFENANDEIIHLDPDGVILNVNRKIEDIFGYKREDVIGKNFTDLGFFIPQHSEEANKKFRQVLESEGVQGLVEFQGKHKNGNTVFIEASVSPIKKRKKLKGILIIVRDITARKQMQERLNQYSEELEQNLHELQIAYEQLKELDKMKDAFLSTVSHELRTPLTSIKSFAEILLTYESDKETQKEFLEIINSESDRLTRLINDTLDLSKIESGQMNWETTLVDISEVIDIATATTDMLSNRMSLNMVVEKQDNLPMVWGDRDRLVQVMNNLIGNAIKFSKEGGTINIKAETVVGDIEKMTSPMIKVSVTDNGRGIAPEDQEMVFQKFTQVGDTLRDKPAGTGLGLPISKEIVEYYSGQIWVESELDKGSTFAFTLPIVWDEEKSDIQVCDEEPEEEAEEETKGPKKKDTILVVDDEANIRHYLSYNLKQKGYRVIQASSGKEAIQKVRKYCPDLITLDVIMPDLNGFDVASKLKEDPATQNIPILIVSVTDDRKQMFQIGIDDYLTKPFSEEMIIEKVTHLLRNPKGTILVVDDDKNLVRSIEFELQQRGYSTSVAHDGEEALDMVGTNPPDLIVLDIMMPKLDGHAVIKNLKSKHETAGIPIIVLTGIELDGEKTKVLSLGADEYLVKSGGLSKLFDTAADILTG